jgi:hypothetical protein
MIDLSPERQALLQQVVDIQERSLYGASMIFKGLRQSSDPEVSQVSGVAFEALVNTQLVLEALIDRLNATQH